MNPEKLDTQIRGHHPDSPSSLQSSAACPHFVNLQRETEASAIGVLQHKATETRDLSILEEPEHIAAVQRCLKVEDDWIEKLKSLGFEVDVVHEKYLPVCPWEIVEDEFGKAWTGITGGYPDTLIRAVDPHTNQHIVVIPDWKFGKILVTPTKDNLQGMAYALAALQQDPDATEAVVVFYHPHIEQDAPLPEYTHVFQRKDMAEMELKIRHAIALKHRAKREGWASEIKPCPSTNLCIWCKHLDCASCPAVAQLAMVTTAKHEGLAVPDEVRPNYLTEPAHMKEAYRLSGVLEKFAKAVRKRITDAVLTEGVVIDGMKVVTKSDREIVSIAAVRDVAMQAGLTIEQFEECLSLPITKVEAAVKKLAAKGRGAEAIRQLTIALDEVGATKKGRPYSYLVEAKEDATDI